MPAPSTPLIVHVPVPEPVRQAAARGLALRRAAGRGGTERGAETARRLAKAETVPLGFVARVAQYFPRHAGDRLQDTGRAGRPLSNGYIAWLLWGGNAGRRWSGAVVADARRRGFLPPGKSRTAG